MAHVRQSIRDNVVTATTGLSTTGSNVFRTRVYPLESGTFPGYAVVADPVEIFKARVNQMNIEAGETATISLTVESRLVDWERRPVRRYNNADQQVAFSGDMGFEFVP